MSERLDESAMQVLAAGLAKIIDIPFVESLQNAAIPKEVAANIYNEVCLRAPREASAVA